LHSQAQRYIDIVQICGAQNTVAHLTFVRAWHACPSSDPWLEMYAQAAESAKGKQRLRKNVLLADARQHVDKLTLSCGGEESFYVRVDDRNFGPYQKVNIQRMADPSTKQPMEFPVQVFFPLDN